MTQRNAIQRFGGEEVGAELAVIIREYVEGQLEPLKARIAQLEATGIKYLGAYQRASGYSRGSVVTHSGSMWVALKDVPHGTTPGADPSAWQLSVKALTPPAPAKAGGARR